MSISLEPVPHWSAPLSEKLVFFVLVVGIVFLVGSRSRSQAKLWRVVLLILIALAVMGLVAVT